VTLFDHALKFAGPARAIGSCSGNGDPRAVSAAPIPTSRLTTIRPPATRLFLRDSHDGAVPPLLPKWARRTCSTIRVPHHADRLHIHSSSFRLERTPGRCKPTISAVPCAPVYRRGPQNVAQAVAQPHVAHPGQRSKRKHRAPLSRQRSGKTGGCWTATAALQ